MRVRVRGKGGDGGALACVTAAEKLRSLAIAQHLRWCAAGVTRRPPKIRIRESLPEAEGCSRERQALGVALLISAGLRRPGVLFEPSILVLPRLGRVRP